MASKQDSYQCAECGWTSTRWVGRCGECQTWGSLAQRAAPALTRVDSVIPATKALRIGEVSIKASDRRLIGIAELDRVLGGGLVPGVVVLLAGEPGVGKSTLLLEVAARWARSGQRTLYVTGEESAAQVRMRATRTGALAPELYLAAETDLGTLLGHVTEVAPSLLVVDSVQTICTAQADGAAGGVTQVREVTTVLTREAKRRGMAVIIIGHVTKDGSIAGPRTMEHLVDVVLSFEGERHSGFRMVRATKNRFGPSDEVGCFEMTGAGIVEVADPSGLFTSQHAEPVPGTCLSVTVEGRRPLLTEVQALVAQVGANTPVKRVSHGVDAGRVSMILAVLQRKAKLPLYKRDIYTATVGGARVSDPSADLAIAMAVASATLDIALPARTVALGEVGLAGDLRRVPGLDRRLAEAARLGIRTAIVPLQQDTWIEQPKPPRMTVIEVSHLNEALVAYDLRRLRAVQ